MKRDTKSWWSCLSYLKAYSVEVVMTVSDRARALIQVAGADYLDSYSMPDLFHFMQDLGKTVGSKLGLQVSRAQKKCSEESAISTQSETYEVLRQDLTDKEQRLQSYTALRENINKAVHPFNENDQYFSADELAKNLQTNFTQIRQVAGQAGIDIAVKKGEKILKQIPDIAQGVAYWISWLNKKIEQSIWSEQEKILLDSLLPYAYWQVHQTKKTSKKKDKALNEYYQKRVLGAKLKFEQALSQYPLSEQRKELLINWAFKQVATFQRASSQVEGRNGYLAFVHHAHKGMTEQRKKVLTVVHNFDIRRADAKTPAQRLFNQEFPDLFEFILQNVEELPRPRQRKNKYAITN